MINKLGILEPVELYSMELVHFGATLVALELITADYYYNFFNPF